ncbi:Uncharacterized protein dnm_096470 [Desulfonema magnum]|uniref:Uncharacterized protein n=1 Tax=Desulfonema magnum TaxID=45655 RepID=A0A975BXM5_9BACT|nr:Uncharacterized protein dnm_096470 [Desulfonema magnum]
MTSFILSEKLFTFSKGVLKFHFSILSNCQPENEGCLSFFYLFLPEP